MLLIFQIFLDCHVAAFLAMTAYSDLPCRATRSRAIGVTPARVNDIANGKRGISADSALRLGRYFGTTPELWMNLQKRYELETARHELRGFLAHIQPRAA